jgi:hypothetical protein
MGDYGPGDVFAAQSGIDTGAAVLDGGGTDLASYISKGLDLVASAASSYQSAKARIDAAAAAAAASVTPKALPGSLPQQKPAGDGLGWLFGLGAVLLLVRALK